MNRFTSDEEQAEAQAGCRPSMQVQHANKLLPQHNILLKCNTYECRANCQSQRGTRRWLVEIVIWRLSMPLLPCTHPFKYRLYFGAAGQCRVRYDNERGKGDHKHVNDDEAPYRFVSVNKLLDDFQHDVETWR